MADRNKLAAEVLELKKQVDTYKGVISVFLKSLQDLGDLAQYADLKSTALQRLLVKKEIFSEEEYTELFDECKEEYKKVLDEHVKKQALGEGENTDEQEEKK